MIKWTRLHGRYFCRHVQSPRKDVVNYKTFWFFEINWDREQFREGFAPPQSHNTPFARRTAARADQFRRRREGPEEPETRSWLYDLGRGLRRDAGMVRRHAERGWCACRRRSPSVQTCHSCGTVRPPSRVDVAFRRIASGFPRTSARFSGENFR